MDNGDLENGGIPLQQVRTVDISRHYDKNSHWYKGIYYMNPSPEELNKSRELQSDTVMHRDFLGRITQMPKDLARYLSPTYAKPFHLIVQATSGAFRDRQGEWRRTKLTGKPRSLIRLSVWAIGDIRDTRPVDPTDILLLSLKIFLILPAMIVLMPLPSRRGRLSEAYPTFFGRSWDYPKDPRNSLDAKPLEAQPREPGNDPHPLRMEDVNRRLYRGALYEISGNHDLLLRPRRLMIKQNGVWALSIKDLQDAGRPPITEPEHYIVISYTSRQFSVDQKNNNNPQPELQRLAERMAAREGVSAYWIDFRCRAENQPEMTDDLHRICDVFRGARQVYAAIPNRNIESKRFWGSRMWCLPEALLCSQQKIVFCTPDGDVEEYTKIQLAAHIWKDGQTTRLLAEHYTGLLTLSRLELISLGLEALNERFVPGQGWTKGDVAYALMALLRYRPRMDPHATSFQVLARLSLANDSDRIVERAVCLLPEPGKKYRSAFVLEDKLGAKLWDIDPMCQVAGVGDNDSVFLDGCQGASIRWKNVPRIYFYGRNIWKKRWASRGWRTAPLWFLIGLIMVITGGKSKDATVASTGTFFFLVGLAMLLYAPWAVQRMHSGKVWGSTPWLIGFEGILPLKEIERVFFGNAVGRLSYAPSSGLYTKKDQCERIGKQPEPPALEITDKYRYFTLVDTGPSMHVHIFKAKAPPTVALICGKEGGMLRVVLCSYEAQGNLLRRESVLRMETPMLSMTKMYSWLRLSLEVDLEPVPATEQNSRQTTNGQQPGADGEVATG